MEDVLFSILIANYNGEKYLRDCIDSVLAQTYSNWEIVLVDDGSTDNSQAVYDEYAVDKRIHIYIRNENKGCTYTKAECIGYAKGELCGFLDADDTLAEDAILHMINAHMDDSVSIVSSVYRMIDENGVYLKSNRLLSLIGGGGGAYLIGRNYSPEHFVSFKKKYYLLTKGLDVTHKYGDDQELYLLLEEVGKWLVLDKELYNYRIISNSVSRQKTFECYFWNMIVRYEACIRRGIDPKLYAYLDYEESLNKFAEIVSHMKEIEIRNSLPYKLGSLLLLPIKKIKMIFNK